MKSSFKIIFKFNRVRENLLVHDLELGGKLLQHYGHENVSYSLTDRRVAQLPVLAGGLLQKLPGRLICAGVVS